MELHGSVALVTGGTRGYGHGIAQVLRQAGAEVWITGRDQAGLDAACTRLGVRGIRADATRSEDWDRVFATVTAASGGRLDILVNNAGAGVAIAPVHEQSDEAILASLQTNLAGAILGCRRAGALMSRQGRGTIINISSVCAQHAWPGWSVYTAAKAGLSKFGHGLHTELRPFGVRVTTIAPSWGATGFAGAARLAPHDPAIAGQVMQPEELGRIVAFVCALPAHLTIPDLTVQPMVQDITPM
ncbi:MAG: SDR family NAD(P)-dependent oxidoreductase [Planctomycetes bacterium]|nr:SDR family NAD(P)-dependent oxidoreductase [Planctomycetota bacterium]